MDDRKLHTHAQLKQESADKFAPEQKKSSDPHNRYTPEEWKRADANIGIIQLISGTTAKGEDFYAYISVRPSVQEEFTRKMLAGERLNVGDFGKVLKKGYGAEPSEDVKKYMEETYGVDPEFMSRLGESIAERLQKDKK